MFPTIKDWSKVTTEHAKFIFEQAERKVEESIKTCDGLSSKIYTLLAINIGAWLTLCGFLFSNIYSTVKHLDLVVIASIAVLYILFIIVYGFIYVYPKGYHVPGSQPKDLFVQDFFEAEKAETTTMYLYSSEANNYQGRIEHNSTLNRKRAACLKNMIVADCLLPIIAIVVYLALEAVFHFL